MLLKSLIALVFIGMLASLVAGAGFLLRDGSRSRRLLTSLKWRVGLAVCLVILLVIGFSTGMLD
ncbi:MAG: DUF2909 domain-containing protein [Cobetia sp.]|jgi:hypothetical protein|uniref:DUF2909 domain-containing protein n=1 Tax=Cobetia amphilecti TaxID=1055104 RepID=A0AAP4U1J6_9GAMM|nr:MULTISPECIES: DUF2909 domain-containing protein [Cobetia]MBR9753697.1 DUF2909 domain-containing protein [Gammaproteobacteria bacterium]NVN55125.1 DUF2909 domain-containing protein [bacterium Scap17]KGA00875.1 hypothetical protein KP05_16635 [Cobetia amphilecti]KPM81911.1 hypothetical protein AOG28_00405 [Cobetia sp. UCD-24C]MBE2168523.1 DUF2909 domain-containing protein [Cobetia sp. 2AS1]|tara:strand:+ start:144 stop:335 length:192 start_codon:yes stop_codon:yes gene_type:complete